MVNFLIDSFYKKSNNKIIKILDYKIWEQYEEVQLDEYIEVLKSKLDKDYMIKTEFLNIGL